MSATNFFHCCANCGSAEDVSAGTTRCPGCSAPITPDEMDINAFTDLQEDLRNAYRAAEKHTQRALLLRVLKWLGDGPTALQLNETGIEEWLPKSDYDTLFQRYADVCADLALARGPTNYTDEWLEKVVDLIRAFAGNQADDIPDDLWACLRNRPANSTPAPVALGGEKGEARKYDDVLVPFVAAMRKELHANTRKGDRPGWLAMDANTALLEVYWHAAKLSAAVKNNDGPAIQEHSADVANMAMMVLDICGGLAWVEVAADRAQRSGVSADPLPDLHAQIMNLPGKDLSCFSETSEHRRAYQSGHRDARLAAAELASQHQVKKGELS